LQQLLFETEHSASMNLSSVIEYYWYREWLDAVNSSSKGVPNPYLVFFSYKHVFDGLYRTATEGMCAMLAKQPAKIL